MGIPKVHAVKINKKIVLPTGKDPRWSWSNGRDPNPPSGTPVGVTRSSLRDRLRDLAPDLVAWVGVLMFVAAVCYGIAGWILR